jgi:uncharacterized membrane-anchored protein YitT (DUF2179 family)
VYSFLISVPSLSPFSSCTPTKLTYTFIIIFLVFSEPHLYWLLTLNIPYLVFIFRCLGSSKTSVQVQGPKLYVTFRNRLDFDDDGVLAPPSKTQVQGLSLVGCSQLFVLYIRSYPPYLGAGLAQAV